MFEVDRRIYRVDRWALPVPGGVPLRAVGYFAATLLAVIVLGALPGIGELVGALSPPLRYVVLPLAVAVLGTQAAPDGRAAHRFAWDWLRLRLRARRRCAGRVVRARGRAGARGTASWRVRWDGDGARAASRPRARAGAGDVQRAGATVDGRGGWSPASRTASAGSRWCCAAATVLEVRP